MDAQTPTNSRWWLLAEVTAPLVVPAVGTTLTLLVQAAF